MGRLKMAVALVSITAAAKRLLRKPFIKLEYRVTYPRGGRSNMTMRYKKNEAVEDATVLGCGCGMLVLGIVLNLVIWALFIAVGVVVLKAFGVL